VEQTLELMQLPDKKYAGDTKIPSVLHFVEKLVPAYFATTFQDSWGFHGISWDFHVSFLYLSTSFRIGTCHHMSVRCRVATKKLTTASTTSGPDAVGHTSAHYIQGFQGHHNNPLRHRESSRHRHRIDIGYRML
jgi:hypothetical protein